MASIFHRRAVGSGPIRSAAAAARHDVRRRSATQATASSSSRSSPRGRARESDAKLLEWAKGMGATPMDAFTIRSDEATGVRGVYTKRALEADSVICEVPRKIALEVTTAKSKCPIEGLDQEFWDRCDWWGKLACLLLDERRKGDSSPLGVYLSALPEAIPTPLHWSQDQLDLLQYKPIEEEIEKQRASWFALYDKYAAAWSSPAPVASRDDFIHAIECVRSRTFSGPYEGSNWETRTKQYFLVAVLAVLYVLGGFGEAYQAFNGVVAVFLTILFRDLLVQRNPRSIRYVLCPFLDMFNHRPGVESDPSYEYFRNTFSLSLNEGVEANQEVCINYGNRGNDELMQYYGFVVSDNKFDTYTVCDFQAKAVATLREVGDELGVAKGADGVRAHVERREAMVQGGEDGSKDRAVIRPKQRGITDRAMQTLRLLVSSDDDLEGRSALLDFGSKVSDENEGRSLALMCAVLRRELAEVLPTTVEEDERILGNLRKMGKDLDSEEVGAKVQALQFRMAKKKVLADFLKKNQEA